MLRRPTFRRLGAWLGRVGGIADGSDPPAVPAVPASASTDAPTRATEPEPVPLEPPLGCHHAQGLRLAAAHRWNWAQRELERATYEAADGPPAADLACVREIRRQLRVLRKWPRDVPAHLALGQAYFELGLGDEREVGARGGAIGLCRGGDVEECSAATEPREFSRHRRYRVNRGC